MCPRCKSQARRHPDDGYIFCFQCGEICLLEPLEYVMHASQRRNHDPASLKMFHECPGCGIEIMARSKRCKACADKERVKAL